MRKTSPSAVSVSIKHTHPRPPEEEVADCVMYVIYVSARAPILY